MPATTASEDRHEPDWVMAESSDLDAVVRWICGVCGTPHGMPANHPPTTYR